MTEHDASRFFENMLFLALCVIGEFGFWFACLLFALELWRHFGGQW
jgi:hypothetical protein